MTETKVTRYSIVGTNFVPDADAIIKIMTPGTRLWLVREPTNQHDANAVAVWTMDKRIGYVSRKVNAVLAKFIDDHGEPYAALGGMAMDSAALEQKAITGKFVRSPNSAFPQIEL